MPFYPLIKATAYGRGSLLRIEPWSVLVGTPLRGSQIQDTSRAFQENLHFVSTSGFGCAARVKTRRRPSWKMAEDHQDGQDAPCSPFISDRQWGTMHLVNYLV